MPGYGAGVRLAALTNANAVDRYFNAKCDQEGTDHQNETGYRERKCCRALRQEYQHERGREERERHQNPHRKGQIPDGRLTDFQKRLRTKTGDAPPLLDRLSTSRECPAARVLARHRS